MSWQREGHRIGLLFGVKLEKGAIQCSLRFEPGQLKG